MKPLFTSLKSGLLALSLVAGVTAESVAGPILQPDLRLATNTAAPNIVPVRDSWAGNNNSGNVQNWRWRHGNRNFSRNWDNGGDWRWRHHRRHRHFNGGDAAILGLGLGLGLGSVYGNYYDPYQYDYYPRYVQPRRIYRAQRLSSAHVEWCYDRYRSYRAWDNTFQPNYGPRKQCWSPYS